MPVCAPIAALTASTLLEDKYFAASAKVAPSFKLQTPTINGFLGVSVGICATGVEVVKTGFAHVVMALIFAACLPLLGFVQASEAAP